jgi:hypothetical protein
VWCAREDSNLWPFAPEANALSRLSYGRAIDSLKSMQEEASMHTEQSITERTGLKSVPQVS